MTVRQMFDSQLHELHKNLLSMGMLVDVAIYKAVKSLVDKDAALAQEVINGDQTINEMELEIERRSFELIALQQPVGSDLRRIVTTIKVATDLERMADHAVSIAKVTMRLHNDVYAKPLIDIPEMGELVKDMVHRALKAYIDIDLKAAKSIAACDDQLDQHFYAIYGDLVNLMIQDSRHIEQATYLIFVAQYLERIGDYVTNICEWIVYLKTGKLVELN